MARSWNGDAPLFKKGLKMPTKKVLIADDEADLVRVLTNRLRHLGYEVVAAVNGEETVAKIGQEKPDLLILDVLMPKMSGLQVMQWLRDRGSAARLPVLIISGKESMKDFFEGFPVHEFIAKPFDMEDFVRKVEKLIGKPGASGAGAKRLVLLGVKEMVRNKVRDFFSVSGWEVSVALDEKDAVRMAKDVFPDAVLCEYANPEWEGYALDTAVFTKLMEQDRLLSKIPVHVYCSSGAFIEAMKSYPPERLIKYSETSDLLTAVAQRLGIKT